jgi:hypothetical protein
MLRGPGCAGTSVTGAPPASDAAITVPGLS